MSIDRTTTVSDLEKMVEEYRALQEDPGSNPAIKGILEATIAGMIRLAGIKGFLSSAGTLAIIKKDSSELELQIFNVEAIDHGNHG